MMVFSRIGDGTLSFLCASIVNLNFDNYLGLHRLLFLLLQK